MATYSTPFKGGTVSAISGTSLTVAGFTPDAGDVGRLVIITTGDARLQHREITAVSGQVLTIAHAMDTNPFIDPTADQRASDSLPANGDGCVISYLATDLVASDAQMSLSGNNNLLITGAVTAQTEAYIFYKDLNVEGSADNIRSGRGGGHIFGYYGYVANEDGYPKHACNLIITGGGTGNPFRVSSGSFGLFDMYGGNMYIPSATPFGRLYENTERALDTQTRILFVDVYGSLGGRVGGNRSMLVLSNQNSQTVFGIFNPRSPVARVEFTAIDCNQAGYVFLSEAPEGRAVFPRLVNIAVRLLRVTGGGSGVYEVVAKKSEVDLLPAFATVDSSAASHILRYGNLMRPKMVQGTGLPVTGELTTRLYDTTNAFIEEQTINDASYTELFVRHTDIVSLAGTRNLSDGTQYAPYSLRLVQSGKQFTIANIDAEDTFEPNIVMLDDANFTVADKAAALAVIPNDTESVYNYSVAWMEDNITDETGFIFSSNGDSITTTYDVIIDPAAAADFAVAGNTVTLKAFSGKMNANSITVADGVDLTGSTFNTLNLTTAVNLNNVTVTGTLTYNDNASKEITYSNVSVGTLANDGTGIITVNRSNSTVGDESDGEVNTQLAPTPSTLSLIAPGANWAIFNNDGTFIEYGSGNKTYNNVAVDTGVWSVVVHSPGKAAEQFTWAASTGITANFTYSDTTLQRPEGGAIYSNSDTTGLTTFVNGDTYVETQLPNQQVPIQTVIDSIQDFLTTEAGIRHMFSTQILASPSFGVLSGVTYLLNVTGYQYDSTTGNTPEAAIPAVLVSSASHTNIRTTNGGLSLVAAAVTVEQIWSYVLSGTTDAGSAAKVISDITTALAAIETKAEADTRQTALITEHDATQSALVTINNNIGLMPGLTAIRAEIDASLAAYDGPTKAELDSAIDSLNDADITALQAAVDGLVANQGDWATATGFSTHNVAAIVTALQAVSNDFKADLSALETKAQADSRQTVLVNDIANIETADITALESKIDVIDTIVDAIVVDTNELQLNQGNWATATGFSTHSAADVWAAATRTLTATAALSASDIAAIATAVEAAILNEGDGQAVVNALVTAIGNANVDELALVAAIRADLERTGGTLDNLATSSSGLTAAQVWDYLESNGVTVGSMGAILVEARVRAKQAAQLSA